MMLTESGKRISRKWNQKKISGSYTYDGTGLRQSKTVNGVTTNQIWSGGNIVVETNSDGTVFANYYRGIKLFGADIKGTDTYYSYNGHGDTTKLIGTNGNVLANYDYDAFGNRTEANGNIYNPFRYCGEYTDDETGLIYLRARYYDAGIGRFISEDPIKDGQNWYVYCANNPIRYIDLWGLAPLDKFATPEEAAADFGLYIGQTSIDKEEEYAAYIYKATNQYGKVYYYYDKPRNDLKTHKERQIGFFITWSGIHPFATVHTHGAYNADSENEGDEFSNLNFIASGNPNDSDTFNSDSSGLDYYVVTPKGNLKKYIANSGNYAGILIRSDMPIDSRIEIHKQMKSTLFWKLLQISFPKGTAQDYVNARRKNPNSWLDTINALERFR